MFCPDFRHRLLSRLGPSLAFGAWGLVLLLCPSTHAQNYSIDWHTINGGGGTSTGGLYSISGTIGQPAVTDKQMTNGTFSLTGGFWSILAVQSPDLPLLSIARQGASVR